MATYLQDGVGAFPQEQGFTPNYNFIMRTLELRQNQYDQNFAQIKSVQNSILNAELSREDNKQKRSLILANADKALKDLSTVDLSIAKNATAAKSVFKPFYEDVDILVDLGYTKGNKSETMRGMSLRDSEKEENRKRYWSHGIQHLQDQLDDFKAASPEQARNMRPGRYVAKPQVADEIFTLFKDGKLKVSIDQISGQEKITYENGEFSVTPLTNLYISKVQNDPEALEGFRVYGSVERRRFVNNAVVNGTYGTKEEAEAAHTQALINDYTALQDKGIEKSTLALNTLNTRLTALQKKLDQGQILEGSEEEAALVRAEMEKAALEEKIKEYKINKTNAPNIVERDPAGFLGQIFMHKSANDLAVALSSVSMSKKIDVNQAYKDFVFSKEFERFKTDEQIRLEEAKSRLNIDEEKIKKEHKASTGSRTTSSNQSLLENLNRPLLQDVPEGAGVGQTSNNRASAYDQNLEMKNGLFQKREDIKRAFVLDALSFSELVGDDGKPLNQTQLRTLSGKKLDEFLSIASDRMKALKASSTESSEYAKYRKLEDHSRQLQQVNAALTAASRWNQDKIKNIVSHLESTETFPEKRITKTKIVGKEAREQTYEEVIPGKNEGWIYKHLLQDDILLNDNEFHRGKFLEQIKKDKNFESLVNTRFIENLSRYTNTVARQGFNPSLIPGNYSLLTKDQVRTQVLTEFKDNFSKYRQKVVDEWNKQGLNFFAEYNIMSGGGGTYSKAATFGGNSEVSGEMADLLTEDLLSKLPSMGSGNMIVVAGPDVPDGVKNAKHDASLEKMLVSGGLLQNELFQAIRQGKNANLKTYTFRSNMVGGNDPNYSAYTLTFDTDFLNKLSSMKDSQDKLLYPDIEKIMNGVTIYVKKDKDNTLARSKSTVGEIDILVNTNPQGVHHQIVSEGSRPELNYEIEIRKNILGSGYKLIQKLPEYSVKDLSGKPKIIEIDLPSNIDLSTEYYYRVNELMNMEQLNKKMMEQYVKSQPNKSSKERIQQLVQTGR